MIIPTAGLIWYFIVNILFGYVGFRYETQYYLLVILHEWILSARDIFICLVPVILLTLKLILPRLTWKTLVATSLLTGFILSLPSLHHNMQRWEIILDIIHDLPITEIRFSRFEHGISDSPSGLNLDFVIDDDSYFYVEQTIIERLSEANARLADYPLGNGYYLQANFYADRITPDRSSISRHFRYDFMGSNGVIKGTIDVR